MSEWTVDVWRAASSCAQFSAHLSSILCVKTNYFSFIVLSSLSSSKSCLERSKWMLTEIQWIKRLGGVGRVGDICQMRRRRVGWRVDGRIARWIFHHDFRHGRWCLVGSVGRCYHFCARFAARLKVESTQCWAGRCIYWIVIGAAWSIWTWWAWHVHGSHLCDGADDFRRDWLWCGHCNSSWWEEKKKEEI